MPELAALTRILETTASGQGDLTLISGEAGVGKSRLVADVTASAKEHGYRVCQGNCFLPDMTIPYAPFRDLLRAQYVWRVASTTPQAEPAAEELFRLLPGIIPLEAETIAIAPEERKQLIFGALTRFLAGLSRQCPVLLIIEDIHWADEASLDFLRYLIRQLKSVPILLALTYRSDEISARLRELLTYLDRERLGREYLLAPLSRSEVGLMVRATLEHAWPVREEQLDALYALTEGNPFFVEEVLKSALEVADDGAEHLSASLLEHGIPRSVSAIVRQRMEALDAEAHHTLALAAVTGRTVAWSLLLELTGLSEDRLLAQVGILVAAQLLVEDSPHRLAFRHALTREAVYSTLLVRDRRALHATIGETIERMHPERLVDHASELSYHFSVAEEWARALAYAVQAGEQAHALHAPVAAVEQFTRALTAAQHLQLDSLASYLRDRGLAYETLGDFEHALSDLLGALADARAHGDQHAELRILLDLGMTWASRDYAETGAYYQWALTLARELGDPETLAHSLNRVGNWHLNADQPHTAATFHAQALTIFEQQSNQHAQAETHDLLGMVYYQCARHQQAAEHLLRAVDIFRKLDDRQGLSSALAVAVLTASWGWSQADAPSHLVDDMLPQLGKEALAAAQESHSRAAAAYACLTVGGVMSVRGQYHQAFALLEEGLEIAQAGEHRQWQVGIHCALARLYLDLLHPEKAIPHGITAHTLAAELGSLIWDRLSAGMLLAIAASGDAPAEIAARIAKVQVDHLTPTTSAQRDLLFCLATYALARGDAEQALHVADALLATAVGCEHEADAPSVALLRGRALARLGHTVQAEATMRAVLAGPMVQVFRPQLWRSRVALGNLLARRGDIAGAAQHHWQAEIELAALAELLPDLALQDTFLRRAHATMTGPTGKQLSRAPARPKQDRDPLTRREREVAHLVSQGKSNREIANTLTLSERTVEDHVSNILAKLGFASRSRIAAWIAAQIGTTEGRA